MKLALICEKCGNPHTTENDDEAVLVIDFRKKELSFICQNKTCKHDNVFSMDSWRDRVTTSPLPRIRIT
jgi:hypothetical protein